jgi:leucyl-tRNA synthetase
VNYETHAHSPSPPRSGGSSDRSPTPAHLHRPMVHTVQSVTADVEAFKFNTAIATLMECLNDLVAYRRTHGVTEELAGAVRTFVLLLAPFAPHVAAELWARLGGPYSVHQQAWPTWEAPEETITLVVQVDGRVRGKLTVPANIGEDEARRRALECANVRRQLEGRRVARAIYVPGRLVNVVTEG